MYNRILVRLKYRLGQKLADVEELRNSFDKLATTTYAEYVKSVVHFDVLNVFAWELKTPLTKGSDIPQAIFTGLSTHKNVETFIASVTTHPESGFSIEHIKEAFMRFKSTLDLSSFDFYALRVAASRTCDISVRDTSLQMRDFVEEVMAKDHKYAERSFNAKKLVEEAQARIKASQPAETSTATTTTTTTSTESMDLEEKVLTELAIKEKPVLPVGAAAAAAAAGFRVITFHCDLFKGCGHWGVNAYEGAAVYKPNIHAQGQGSILKHKDGIKAAAADKMDEHSAAVDAAGSDLPNPSVCAFGGIGDRVIVVKIGEIFLKKGNRQRFMQQLHNNIQFKIGNRARVYRSNHLFMVLPCPQRVRTEAEVNASNNNNNSNVNGNVNVNVNVNGMEDGALAVSLLKRPNGTATTEDDTTSTSTSTEASTATNTTSAASPQYVSRPFSDADVAWLVDTIAAVPGCETVVPAVRTPPSFNAILRGVHFALALAGLQNNEDLVELDAKAEAGRNIPRPPAYIPALGSLTTIDPAHVAKAAQAAYRAEIEFAKSNSQTVEDQIVKDMAAGKATVPLIPASMAPNSEITPDSDVAKGLLAIAHLGFKVDAHCHSPCPFPSRSAFQRDIMGCNRKSVAGLCNLPTILSPTQAAYERQQQLLLQQQQQQQQQGQQDGSTTEVKDAPVAYVQPKSNIDLRIESTADFGLISFTGGRDYVEAVGGQPTGTGVDTQTVVALLSGGMDSPVAAFRMMVRGMRVILVHFQNANAADEHTVKEKIIRIAERLSRYQVTTYLHIVPFSALQDAIITQVPGPARMIVYRRFMMQVASRIAMKYNARFLVTGDAIGQVASQTPANLFATYSTSELPILPPLIGANKREIMQTAEKIGTYEISALPYGDCCSYFLAKHPMTSIRPEVFRKYEAAVGVNIEGGAMRLVRDAYNAAALFRWHRPADGMVLLRELRPVFSQYRDVVNEMMKACPAFPGANSDDEEENDAKGLAAAAQIEKKVLKEAADKKKREAKAAAKAAAKAGAPAVAGADGAAATGASTSTAGDVEGEAKAGSSLEMNDVTPAPTTAAAANGKPRKRRDEEEAFEDGEFDSIEHKLLEQVNVRVAMRGVADLTRTKKAAATGADAADPAAIEEDDENSGRVSPPRGVAQKRRYEQDAEGKDLEAGVEMVGKQTRFDTNSTSTSSTSSTTMDVPENVDPLLASSISSVLTASSPSTASSSSSTSTTAYLDNAATTPMHPKVLGAMLPYLAGTNFGNSSSSHSMGNVAAAAVEETRRIVLGVVNGTNASPLPFSGNAGASAASLMSFGASNSNSNSNSATPNGLSSSSNSSSTSSSSPTAESSSYFASNKVMRKRELSLLFTSGGTEANNLAILGSVRAAVEQAAASLPPIGSPDRPTSLRVHLITSSMEHSAILEPITAVATSAASTGIGSAGAYIPVQVDISYVKNDTTGLVDTRHLDYLLSSDLYLVNANNAAAASVPPSSSTASDAPQSPTSASASTSSSPLNRVRHVLTLVSVMHANNEVGAVQPLTKIGEMCYAFKTGSVKAFNAAAVLGTEASSSPPSSMSDASSSSSSSSSTTTTTTSGTASTPLPVLFHTDACQSFGKFFIDVEESKLDLVTLNGHKIYGPKGVGALFVRPGVQLCALAWGGGHEASLRPGTLNVPGIVGLGAAAALLHGVETPLLKPGAGVTSLTTPPQTGVAYAPLVRSYPARPTSYIIPSDINRHIFDTVNKLWTIVNLHFSRPNQHGPRIPFPTKAEVANLKRDNVIIQTGDDAVPTVKPFKSLPTFDEVCKAPATRIPNIISVVFDRNSWMDATGIIKFLSARGTFVSSGRYVHRTSSLTCWFVPILFVVCLPFPLLSSPHCKCFCSLLFTRFFFPLLFFLQCLRQQLGAEALPRAPRDGRQG